MRKVVSLVLWFLRLPFKKGEMGGRGQVAIFAALIFQVLFVFFAMVVNVGLLVHHKINLQNSVDLAAYYGAMKQAEALDAIAHVNYQIRQSWKLMVFRYRGIGMAGNEAKDTPFDPTKEVLGTTANTDEPYNSCPASFCNSYMAWSHMDTKNKENYCRDMCKGQKIRLPGQPFGSSLLGGLLMSRLPSIVSDIDKLSALARAKVKDTCQDASAMNWYALARYVFAFKNDVANRKKVLNRLANSISAKTDDLMDIDGQSVRAGVLQTLFKNMTYQNQAAIDPKTGASANGANGSFEFFNSLAAGGCGGTDGEEGVPPKWLSEIFVKPLYGYLDGACEGEDAVNFKIKILNAIGNDSLPYYREKLDPQLIEFLRSYIQDPLSFDSNEARLWHTTTGYEKNPWCMAYVKVSASTTPKIPFSPFSPVKITATAYAKPFGGRVGPWFYKSWPASADSSSGGAMTDQFDQALPPRVKPGEQTVNVNDDFLRVDHSRYVGDVVGVKSTMTMARYAQAIFKRSGPKTTTPLSMNWWNHLLDQSADLNAINNHGDVLAWDATANRDPGIRTVEVASVIPDQFDIANYSIEPNWWRTFAQRIQKRTDFGGLNVRGDIGFRRDAPAPWDTFTVKDQIALAIPDNTMDYDNALLYVAGRNAQDPKNAFAEVLTSWHNKVPGDYTLEPTRFGKCLPGGVITGDPTEIEKGAPGDCMAGGRTGYSVKIVDEEAITGDQEIGGSGNTGKIKNLPTAK